MYAEHYRVLELCLQALLNPKSYGLGFRGNWRQVRTRHWQGQLVQHIPEAKGTLMGTPNREPREYVYIYMYIHIFLSLSLSGKHKEQKNPYSYYILKVPCLGSF